MSGKNKFIERSLIAALSFFRDSIYADEYARKPGLLQPLDARTKIISVLTCIVLVLFAKDARLILAFYALCLALAFLSRINLLFFLKRTWIFIPLFSLFIVVPALFEALSPGQRLFGFQIFGLHLFVTRQGALSAVTFVLRVATSVSFAVLLTLTTKHSQLLAALRIFGVPQVFVMTLGMCYRYLYLFVKMIENTYLAMKARVGGNLHYVKGQKVVGWNIANLWHRSYSLHAKVYDAMLSRGYRQEARAWGETRMRLRDGIWFTCVLAVAAAAIYYMVKK